MGGPGHRHSLTGLHTNPLGYILLYGSETPTLVRKLSGESERRKVSVPKAHAEERSVSTFGDDLILALNEALAHAKGEGPTMVHTPVTPREVRKQAKLTQAQMAPLMGMSLSGYRKWEQGTRRVSGPAAALLRLIKKEPEAVRRALLASPRDDH